MWGVGKMARKAEKTAEQEVMLIHQQQGEGRQIRRKQQGMEEVS